jgi:tRNA(fMet)-specific endonuclease VapC
MILDTSAYSAAQRGDDRILERLNAAPHVYVPVIVVAELKAGFACGTRRSANERLLGEFMANPNVSTLHIGDKTPDYFADIYAELKKAGRPIGHDDVWIAALAREYNQPLLTLDRDFAAVKDIRLVS